MRGLVLGFFFSVPVISVGAESVSAVSSRTPFSGDLHLKGGMGVDSGYFGVNSELSAIFPSGLAAELQIGTSPTFLVGGGYVLRKNSFMLKFKALAGAQNYAFAFGPGTNADFVFGSFTVGFTGAALITSPGSNISFGGTIGFLL